MKDEGFIHALKKAMEKASDPSDAVQMAAYMQNHFAFYGIKAGPRREILKACLKSTGVLTDPIGTAKALFEEDFRELHMCGQELLYTNRKSWSEKIIEDIEWMICTNSWWDTVDFIAARCAGYYFQCFPKNMHAISLRWNRSDQLWLQRSSLIFQLHYKDKTNTKLLEDYILHLKDQPGFFIRKAIGWALREYSKTDPGFVQELVEKAGLKGLSEREAMRKIRTNDKWTNDK